VLPEALLRAQHTYSETDREQVLALRREGLTFSAISLALNIPPTTCHNWVAAAELRAKSTAAAAAPFWGVNKQAAAQRALSDEEELDLVEAIREWQKDIGGVRWQDIQQLCLAGTASPTPSVATVPHSRCGSAGLLGWLEWRPRPGRVVRSVRRD
jgi:hypothetical protein